MYLISVYAARQLAADAVESTAQPHLHALEAELQVWFEDVFRTT